MSSHESGSVAVSVALLPDDVRRAKELAARRRTTVSQVIAEALRTETFLQQQVADGWHLAVRRGSRVRDVSVPHLEQK
jgi:predicted transcriptional regulator